MKEQFITKRFGPDALAMIKVINQILDDYVAQGYDLSLRQLYYQLVSKNYVPNTEKSYKNVGGLVSDARLAGMIDWDTIKDRGREMIQNNHWNSPAEIVEACAAQFRVDRWADQPNYVEINTPRLIVRVGELGEWSKLILGRIQNRITQQEDQ